MRIALKMVGSSENYEKQMKYLHRVCKNNNCDIDHTYSSDIWIFQNSDD